jgi:hypothetical protein
MPISHPPRRPYQPAPAIDAAKWIAMVETEADESCRIGPRMARGLRALIGFNGRLGCFPAIATVAAAADVSEGTLREGIRRAVALGYLVVTPGARRIVVTGGRRLQHQDANRYEFLMPGAAVPCRAAGVAWRAEWWTRKPRRPGCRVRTRSEAKKESSFYAPAGAADAIAAVDNSWQAQCASAARQLAALGCDVPEAWRR